MITTLAVLTLLAQDPGPMPAAPIVESEQTLAPFRPRLRVAVGSFLGANSFSNDGTDPVPLNTGFLGASLRPGVQLTDRFGLVVEGAYSTTWFFSIARLGLLADYTLNDWLSLSVGGVYGNNVSRTIRIDVSPVPDSNRDYAAGVERLEFHWIYSRSERGARKAIFAALELEEGAALPNGLPAQAGVGGYLTIGFSYW